MSTLNYRSREATPVVRSKMLLELQDVAAELDIERTDVLRLIARGALKSRVVGADKLRVERSGIEALLRQDVELEIGSTFNGWFDGRAEQLRAGEFVAKVRDELKTAVPDEDPGSDRTFPYIRGIAEAGNATPRPMLIAIPGSRELPYRNLAELYVVVSLRRMSFQEVNRRATSARVEGRKARSPLEILYSTPEAHRAIVDESLRRFAEKSISVRHDYPEATRTFSLLHTALPTSLDTAVRLAF